MMNRLLRQHGLLRRHELGVVLAVWGALACSTGALAIAALGAPGMFYDEAWLAQQARAFVEPERVGLMPPGAISTWLFGRPFPMFALPYLGSLKSQLLIPSLFAFGVSLETVRLTTLFWSLLALLFTMLWVRLAFGGAVAVLTGLLVAFDPTWFFFSQMEWGPFTTGLLCRSAGLFFVTRAWQRGGGAGFALGGLLLGLGVYNRADFVLILAALGLGLLVFHREIALRALTERRAMLAGGGVALALGALPTLASARAVLATVGVLRNRGDFAEKLAVFESTLDGSYFYRLMEVGGRYDAMFSVDAPFGLFGLALLAALAATAWSLVRRARKPVPAGHAALALALVALGAAMLALPGATRAHHMLNLMPFAQLLVAAVAVELHRRAARARWQRAAVAGALFAVIAANAHVTVRTEALIQQTGGRGWWSDSLDALASELQQQPGAVAVSFDWGFHLPLLFQTSQPTLLEPYWRMANAVRSRGAWAHRGDARHLYLVHAEPYDRFELSPRLLRAARDLPGETVEIREHRDRRGATSFLSIRVARPHVLRLVGNSFAFHLQ